MFILGVLLVGVSKIIKGDSVIGKPEILHQFSHGLANIPANIESFCFPDATTLVNASQMALSERHVFVLTGARGEKQYGFCKRFYIKNTFDTPFCLCILSTYNYQWRTVFEDVLNILQRIIFPSDELIDRKKIGTKFEKGTELVKEIIKQGDPVPGQSIQINRISIMIPDINEIDYPPSDFTSLVNALESPNKLLYIFVALLLEHRIIFTSANLQRLTDCIFAALQLIYPFEWQYIFVPILPESLLGYCTAPMPFVLGIHSGCIAEIKRLPMDEYLFINLDAGNLRAAPTIIQNVKNVPPRFLQKMKEIEPYFRNRGANLNQIIAQSFHELFFTVLADFRNFFKYDAEAYLFFHKEEFLCNLPKDFRPFCDIFCASQLFHVYIQDLLLFFEKKLPFTRRAFERECHAWSITHPRGFVEQFSIGLNSVVSKYMNNGKLMNDSPIICRGRSDDSRDKQAGAPKENIQPANTDNMKVHSLNDKWAKVPEAVPFHELHDILSPQCTSGILQHHLADPPSPEIPKPEPFPDTLNSTVPSPIPSSNSPRATPSPAASGAPRSPNSATRSAPAPNQKSATGNNLVASLLSPSPSTLSNVFNSLFTGNSYNIISSAVSTAANLALPPAPAASPRRPSTTTQAQTQSPRSQPHAQPQRSSAQAPAARTQSQQQPQQSTQPQAQVQRAQSQQQIPSRAGQSAPSLSSQQLPYISHPTTSVPSAPVQSPPKSQIGTLFDFAEAPRAPAPSNQNASVMNFASEPLQPTSSPLNSRLPPPQDFLMDSISLLPQQPNNIAQGSVLLPTSANTTVIPLQAQPPDPFASLFAPKPPPSGHIVSTILLDDSKSSGAYVSDLLSPNFVSAPANVTQILLPESKQSPRTSPVVQPMGSYESLRNVK